MSAVGTISILVVSTAIATAGSVAPSELMLDRVDGFELTSDPAVDIDYATYAELEPDSVSHIQPDSDVAADMLAAVEVWTSFAGDEVLVVEIVRSTDEGTATTFVDQAAATSIGNGLAATDPPFGGAWSYSGGLDDTWTNMASWNQGPYSVVLTQLSVDETPRDMIDAAAVRQAQLILDATGLEVDEDAAVADEAPVPPTEVPADTGSGGGVPIGMLLIGLVIVVGAIYLVVTLGRKRSAARAEAERPRSADEIIAEARRRGREAVPEPTESTDDIIERARRQAREEVERTANPTRGLGTDERVGDGSKMPDDD